jgi:uncharacterized lipoprotein YddW (UPF0748 family)
VMRLIHPPELPRPLRGKPAADLRSLRGMKRPALFTGFLLLLALIQMGCSLTHPVNGIAPPHTPREFRAAWVATVGNIDWPSRPGLTSDAQRREVLAILDGAKALNLNAVIVQVRTACDALYPSRLEPWSAFLTGTQGKAPDPYYDPLAFWVSEAHRRGIELHAWFNPFRAAVPSYKGPPAGSHISQERPDLVKTFSEFLWLDPGEPAARDDSIRVILDVVRRYDIDGVHIDDYFYPYPKKGIEFPDDPSFARYTRAGGTLPRADWRRANLNAFIERLYRGIKYTKPWVKFGISPFGIYRPGEPAGVRGFDQYNGLFADVKLWFNRGWCDYLSPQLYWKIDSPQPFAKLLAWWALQNGYGRHLWPGLYTSRVVARSASHPTTAPATVARRSANAWTAREILDQIAMVRAQISAPGEVHFSMKAFLADRGAIDESLRDGPYAEPALVPGSPWLGGGRPSAPSVAARGAGSAITVTWRRAWFANRPWMWVASARYGGVWRSQPLPQSVTTFTWPASPLHGAPDAVAVTAVDRVGNESDAVIVPLLGAR